MNGARKNYCGQSDGPWFWRDHLQIKP